MYEYLSFILFLNIDIKLPKKIAMPWNFIIRAVFGIYLIQEHNTVRDALWGWINIERWATSPYLVLMVIAIFISLWLVAIILYLCYYYANKLFIDKIANKIQLILVKKLTFLGGNK